MLVPNRALNGERSTLPRVVIITTHWGDDDDESTTATRLVAGALARNADVDVVHLLEDILEPESVTDSVFSVHRVRHYRPRLLRAGIIRAALAEHDGGSRIPFAAASLLDRYEGDAPHVPATVSELNPDAIVLVGHHQPYDIDALITALGGRKVRLIFLPFTADRSKLATDAIRRIVELTDAIGVAHDEEAVSIRSIWPDFPADAIVPLDLAIPINRSATRQRLFGVRFFGAYVLLIRDFPPGGPRHERTVTHEVLRSVLKNVSVAEVDGEKWRISDRENTLEFPVNPSRVNLWRLMAHAIATVDVRPPGPIGREALESMLLGTPVLVPDPSAAMSHVRAANGGLWYRDAGELFDAARALMSVQLRRRLGEQAREYATAHHGQMADFTVRMADLVLGKDRGN